MEDIKLSLADRMKYYEQIYDNKFEYNNVYLIRLDGNCFSKRIKTWKLKRPFDKDFHGAMVDTCKELIQLIPDAKLIWTGSDEITILCLPTNKKDAWFANRINKVISLAASYCTAYFNKFMNDSLINVKDYPGFFDARIISIPTLDEAINNILSRYNDCKKNSISMWADSVYSHKELLKKNSIEKIQMLKEKNIDWEDSNIVPDWTKYGTFIYKEIVCYNKDTKEEVANKNLAINLFEENPDKYYIRTKLKSKDLTNEYSNMHEKIMPLFFS